MIERNPKGIVAWVLAASIVLFVGCSDRSSTTSRDHTSDFTRHIPVEKVGRITSDDSVVLYKLGDILVHGDSALVVANRGTSSILWLNVNGDRVLQAGRAGEGPGEYKDLTTIRSVSGSVVAWDIFLRRLTIYSSDADAPKMASLQLPGAWRFVGGTIPDGLLLNKPPQEGNNSRRYSRVNISGVVLNSWSGSDLEPPSILYRRSRAGVEGTASLTLMDCFPTILEAFAGNRFYVIDTGSGIVQKVSVYDGSATKHYEFRQRSVFNSETRLRLEKSLSNATATDMQRALLRAGAPDKPVVAWKRAIPSIEGFLFLERASCVPDRPLPMWDVLDPAGNPVGFFSLPMDTHLAGASSTLLAVISVDSSDVEQIDLYRIHLPSSR